MKIKHNPKSGVTIIELSWTETRQFVSANVAQAEVVKSVKEAIKQK